MKRNAGFTLLEFSIVITISGILMIAAIRAYFVWEQDSKYYQMVDKLKTIKQTIADFNKGKTRYPCPADPTLPMTDANAGVEATFVVAGVTYCWGMPETGKLAAPTVAGTPVCNPAGQPFANSKAGGICRILAARDTLADSDTNKDIAEIGGLPFRSMKAATTNQDMTELNMSDALDPWGYQFTYAVTENVLELANNGQGQWGALDVRSESTTTTAGSGVELVLPAQSANYVIVGHGADHNGAYNSSGNVAKACGAVPTSATAPANSAVDNFNCNKGEIFVDGLLSNAAGPSHYDDAVIYSTGYISRLWDYTSLGSFDIYNLNTGGVTVGMNPATISQSSIKLQANADLWVSNQGCYTDPITKISNCWTPSADAPYICQSYAGGTSTCFNPQLFGGYDGSDPTNPNNPASMPTGQVASGNQCPANADPNLVNVVTGLSNGQVVCTTGAQGVTPLSLPIDHHCPGLDDGTTPQKYVFAIQSTGVYCCLVDGTSCAWY